ncbi:hypothetical protein POTOM_029378 [Populus tomentosa]|uniref:Uncharacterized protein n=1 Tax=Populus tomentosa TaxID=118781 RepID=A0A8X7Z6T4_POPTO|nr:hypothetical protein POTOM_029378 [Populus tomentosa]
MTRKAEKWKAEDEKHKNMVEAKNVLDNAYNIRNCVGYNTISLKLVEDDKNIEDVIDQASDGLNWNEPVKTDELEDMLKELRVSAILSLPRLIRVLAGCTMKFLCLLAARQLQPLEILTRDIQNKEDEESEEEELDS